MKRAWFFIVDSPKIGEQMKNVIHNRETATLSGQGGAGGKTF